jgi:hypothetical protein
VVDAIPTIAWSARADGFADFFNRFWGRSGDDKNWSPVSFYTKRHPPTPFDINQLHLIAALPRRRLRVRVPSLRPVPKLFAVKTCPLGLVPTPRSEQRNGRLRPQRSREYRPEGWYRRDPSSQTGVPDGVSVNRFNCIFSVSVAPLSSDGSSDRLCQCPG